MGGQTMSPVQPIGTKKIYTPTTGSFHAYIMTAYISTINEMYDSNAVASIESANMKHALELFCYRMKRL